VRWIWQPFYTLWVVLVFVATLLLGVSFVAILAIPGNARSRRRIWHVIRAWAYAFLYAVGMPVRRVGELPPEGRYVAVLNHQSYIDSVLLLPAVPGYFRPLGKAEMAKIPLFGFVYKQIVLMVDRGSPHSRARSMRLMARALRNECSIAIFPEGTFNETEEPVKEYYDGAFRLAISAGASILPILLPDATKRWHWSAWWKISPGPARIVYMEPVPTKGMTQQDLPALKERIRGLMAEELVRLSR
jgi:1-acyl-sn-glycerol-3-phosphate acyltransferase